MVKEISYHTIIDSTYFVDQILGQSPQGNVYKVQLVSAPNQFYALKLIEIREKDPRTARKIETYIKSEFSLLKSLSHSNIVKVFDFGFDSALKSYYFTMEYLDGQLLYDFFKDENNEKHFPEIVQQILVGLNFLHANKILHYDINPKNIIISKVADGFSVKLLDFGLADINQQQQKAKIKKSLLYISPELYTQTGEISERIDIYSLGVSLLHSISREVALDLSKISGTDFKAHDSRIFNHKLLLEGLSSEKIRRFLAAMTERNPKLRTANAEEALHNLNSIFGTTYPIPKISNHDSFQKNSRFLIRNDIVNRTVNYFCNYRAPGKKQTIIIGGESGSGKSRIAEQLHFNLSCMFHKTLLIKNNTEKLFGVIISLVNQVYLFSSPFLKTDMQAFYKLLTQINRNVRQSTHYQTHFAQILEFLQQCAEIRPLTFIFDEYEQYDLYTQRFLQYMVQKNRSVKINIIILLGLGGTGKRSEEALEFYTESGQTEFLSINPLTVEEIRYVRHFLLGKSDSFPADFEAMLHINGGSNFRKLMLLFDSFVSARVIKKEDGQFRLDNPNALLRVLKMNESTLSRSIIKKLTLAENQILTLITLSSTPLSMERIEQLLLLTPTQSRSAVNRLEKLSLIIGIKKERFIIEYRVYSSGIAFQLLSISVPETLIFILNILNVSGLISDRIPQETINASLLDLSKPCSTTDLTRLLETAKDSNRLLFHCLLIKKIRSVDYSTSLDFKGLLLYFMLIAYRQNGNPEEINSTLQSLNRLQSKLTNPQERIRILNLIIELFSNQNQVKKTAETMLFNSDLLVSENERFVFMSRYLNCFKDCFNAGYKGIARKMAADIARILDKPELQELYAFKYLLHATKLLFKVIPFKPEDLNTVENRILVMQNDPTCQLQLFDLYSTYYSLCRAFKQTLNPNWNIWLLKAIADSEQINNSYHATRLFNLLTSYYFSHNQYRQAITTIRKQVVIAKANNHPELSFYLLNQALVEVLLLTPLNKVLTLQKEGMEIALLNNQQHLHPTCSINLCFTYLQSGDFITALFHWQETYRNFRYSQIKDRYFFIETIIETGFFLLGSKELAQKIEQLYERKLILSEDLTYARNYFANWFTNLVEKKSYTDARGVYFSLTPHSINLPGLVLRFIGSEHKIPTAHQLALAFDNQFKHKPFFKVINPIVNFMLSPDDALMEKIFIILKKSYQSGYELDIYFNTVPLVEYLFLIKSTSTYSRQIVDLVQNLQKSFFERMNDDQKNFFGQIYEFRRAEKSFKRYEQLLKNK